MAAETGGTPLYRALPEKLQPFVPGHLSRVLSILLMYWLTLIIFLLIGFRFGPLVWTELVMFGKQVPAYVERAEDWLLDQPLLSQYFRKEIKAADEEAALIGDPQNGNTLKPVPPPPIARPPLASAPTVEDSADTLEPLRDTSLTEDEKKQAKAHVLNWSERLDEFEPFLKENLNNTVGHVSNLVGTTLSMVVYGLTLLVMVFYFLLDGSHLIKDGLIKSLPASAKPTTAYFLERCHAVMFGFVKTQVLLGMVTGLFMMLVYTVFDVPYAIFLGAFFAISEILPVVGTWIGFTPGIVVLLFINPLKLLAVMGICYIYQSIKDNLVAPKIVGDIMGLHPVMVILSLLICAKIAGLVGVLFAIPLASMVNVLITYLQEGIRPIEKAG
ncbi:MAG: AI-2E family transporter [Vampirovibrionales bacterium]